MVFPVRFWTFISFSKSIYSHLDFAGLITKRNKVPGVEKIIKQRRSIFLFLRLLCYTNVKESRCDGLDVRKKCPQFWLRQISEVQALWEDIFKTDFRKMKRSEMKWSCSGFTFSRVVTCRPMLLVTALRCTVLRCGDFQQESTTVWAGKPKQ